MGISRFFRGLKDSLVATGLTAIVAGTGVGAGVGVARADDGKADSAIERATARYEYSVERHVAGGSALVGGRRPAKRLDRELYDGAGRGEVIDSIGNYANKEFVSIDSENALKFNIGVGVEREGDKARVLFSYEATPIKIESSSRPSADTNFDREFSADTHIYFVLPSGAKLRGVSQRVLTYNHRTGRRMNLFAIPLDEQLNGDFAKVLKRFNESLSFGEKPNPSESQVEQTVDKLVEVVPYGDVFGVAMEYMKIREQRRREELEKRFPGQQIVLMPFNNPTGYPDYTAIGRKTKLYLDTSKVKAGDKGTIVGSNLSFIRETGSSEIANLDGFEFKVLIGERSLEEKVDEKVDGNVAGISGIHGRWMIYSGVGNELGDNKILGIDNEGINYSDGMGRSGESADFGVRNSRGRVFEFPKISGDEFLIKLKGKENKTGNIFFKVISPNVMLTREDVSIFGREEKRPYQASLRIAERTIGELNGKKENAEFPQELYGEWVLGRDNSNNNSKPWTHRVRISDKGKVVDVATDAWIKQEEENVVGYKDYGEEQELLRLKKEDVVQVDRSFILPCEGYRLYGARGVFRDTINREVKHQQTTSGTAWLVRDGQRLYIAFNDDYLKGPFVRK